MNTSTILITAVCGDLGSSTVRSLFNSAKYSLIGTDISPYCPILKYLYEFICVPSANSPHYIQTILSLCEKYHVHVIVPSSEVEILRLKEERKIFEQHDIKLMINSDQILKIFSDKFETIDYIASLGYRVPKTFLLSEFNNHKNIPYPLVVKPRKGCGSRGIMLVNDDVTLDYLRQQNISEFIIQESIGEKNDEYTTGVYSNGDTVSSITFRRVLATGGYSHEVHLVDDDHMHKLAEDIAYNVHLIGSLNIQTRKIGDIHIPFEINPRLSSTVMFRKLAGFTDALWWLELLLGEKEYSYTPLNSEFVGVRWISEEVFT